jgi:hypothetical protein
LPVQNPADDSAGDISVSTHVPIPFSGRPFPKRGIQFDPDNFNHGFLIVTASAAYRTIKIRGTADAIGARQLMQTHKPTTYDLIVESESEDKNRTMLETVIYALFILSAIVSIWQFVVQPIAVPSHTAGFASNQTTQCVQEEI